MNRKFLSLLLALSFILFAFSGCQIGDEASSGTNGTESAETEEKNEEQMPKGLRDLSEYIIVVPANATNSATTLSAYELKDFLSKKGYSLRVFLDNSPVIAGKKTIFVGKTASSAGDMPTGADYSIVENADGNIQIAADSYYGYRGAFRYIEKKGGIPYGVNYTGSATTTQMQKDEGSLRVMFYNVYGFTYWHDANKNQVTGANAPSPALRQDLQSDLLSAYAPDVVGFQEYFENPYHESFTPILNSLGYTEVSVTVAPVNGQSVNCVPLFYKADKVTVVASGHMNYECATLSPSKSITWAVFRENQTNKQVAVFSTHFLQNVGGLTSQECNDKRAQNAEEILALIKTVKDQYPNASVIMGGDLNFWNIWKNYGTNWESETRAYNTLVNGGLTLASKVPGVQSNFQKASESGYTNSYHGFYTYDANKQIYNMASTSIQSQYTLDYIFFDNLTKVDVIRYIILEDDLTCRASDHSPTFVDIILK